MLCLFVEQFHAATPVFMVYEAQGVALDPSRFVNDDAILRVLPQQRHSSRDGFPRRRFVAGEEHSSP